MPQALAMLHSSGSKVLDVSGARDTSYPSSGWFVLYVGTPGVIISCISRPLEVLHILVGIRGTSYLGHYRGMSNVGYGVYHTSG
jgi:hypothetical protein